jgi:hypothetical protein
MISFTSTSAGCSMANATASDSHRAALRTAIPLNSDLRQISESPVVTGCNPIATKSRSAPPRSLDIRPLMSYIVASEIEFDFNFIFCTASFATRLQVIWLGTGEGPVFAAAAILGKSRLAAGVAANHRACAHSAGRKERTDGGWEQTSCLDPATTRAPGSGFSVQSHTADRHWVSVATPGAAPPG